MFDRYWNMRIVFVALVAVLRGEFMSRIGFVIVSVVLKSLVVTGDDVVSNRSLEFVFVAECMRMPLVLTIGLVDDVGVLTTVILGEC